MDIHKMDTISLLHTFKNLIQSLSDVNMDDHYVNNAQMYEEIFNEILKRAEGKELKRFTVFEYGNDKFCINDNHHRVLGGPITKEAADTVVEWLNNCTNSELKFLGE